APDESVDPRPAIPVPGRPRPARGPAAGRSRSPRPPGPKSGPRPRKASSTSTREHLLTPTRLLSIGSRSARVNRRSTGFGSEVAQPRIKGGASRRIRLVGLQEDGAADVLGMSDLIAAVAFRVVHG